jgi:C_GCAxxG_C_C family probable redox protein
MWIISTNGGTFMDRGTKAAELFYNGYNCAQAVAVVFSDLTGLDEAMSARMASSFGGGMGRLREVCGAVSGMLLVAGILYGYDSPSDDVAKKAHYALVQALAGQFREKNGSIICREILKNPPSDPAPSPRTAEYYASRPCARMVYTAASLLEEYINANPIER